MGERVKGQSSGEGGGVRSINGVWNKEELGVDDLRTTDQDASKHEGGRRLGSARDVV